MAVINQELKAALDAAIEQAWINNKHDGTAVYELASLTQVAFLAARYPEVKLALEHINEELDRLYATVDGEIAPDVDAIRQSVSPVPGMATTLSKVQADIALIKPEVDSIEGKMDVIISNLIAIKDNTAPTPNF